LFRTFVIILLLSPAMLCAAPKVLVLGDSLSAGYGINYDQAWVHLLKKKLQIDLPDAEVINASISGETSAGALARLPAALATHKPDLVIVELGGNDGLRGTALERLQDNLEQIIRLVKVDSEALLVQMHIPLNYGKKYTQRFEKIYPLLSEQNDIVLAPFLLDGFATDPEFMQADRIHPKVNAQPLIANNLLPSVYKALGIMLAEDPAEEINRVKPLQQLQSSTEDAAARKE